MIDFILRMTKKREGGEGGGEGGLGFYMKTPIFSTFSRTNELI